jgi:hypothetical protein
MCRPDSRCRSDVYQDGTCDPKFGVVTLGSAETIMVAFLKVKIDDAVITDSGEQRRKPSRA